MRVASDVGVYDGLLRGQATTLWTTKEDNQTHMHMHTTRVWNAGKTRENEKEKEKEKETTIR